MQNSLFFYLICVFYDQFFYSLLVFSEKELSRPQTVNIENNLLNVLYGKYLNVLMGKIIENCNWDDYIHLLQPIKDESDGFHV